MLESRTLGDEEGVALNPPFAVRCCELIRIDSDFGVRSKLPLQASVANEVRTILKGSQRSIHFRWPCQEACQRSGHIGTRYLLYHLMSNCAALYVHLR